MSLLNILARKFILKLAQDAEEHELIKKHFEGASQGSPILNALIQKGIVPVVSGRRWDPYTKNYQYFDSRLGQGAFSEVFEVSYKGKMAVAKITQDKNDFDTTLKLNALKPQLGEDAKYLQVIFDNFDMKIEGKTYHVIIAEKLIPLKGHLQDWMFPDDSDNLNKFNILKKNIDVPDVMEKLSNHLSSLDEWLLEVPQELRNNILEMIEKYLRKAILTAKDRYDFIKIIRNPVIEYITNEYARNKEKYKDLNLIGLEDIVRHDIFDKLKEFTDIATDFPTREGNARHQYELEHFKNSPETKKFMSFLYRLKNEFRINWRDLHSNNIMIRPSTGDLVASDVGLFGDYY